MPRKEEVARGSNGGGPGRMSGCGMELSRCRTGLTMVEGFFAAWGVEIYSRHFLITLRGLRFRLRERTE